MTADTTRDFLTGPPAAISASIPCPAFRKQVLDLVSLAFITDGTHLSAVPGNTWVQNFTTCTQTGVAELFKIQLHQAVPKCTPPPPMDTTVDFAGVLMGAAE